MLQIGRLQGSFLVMTCAVLVLVCFGAGFLAAVFLGGMDTATATAVAGTAIAKSEFAIRTRSSLLAQGQQIARRPVFALSKFAARPVQGLYKAVPGALRPLSPQMALDQALRNQVSEVDRTVVATTANASSNVQATIAAAGNPAAPKPAPGSGGTQAAEKPASASDPAKADKEAAVAEAAPPEVPRRNLPPAMPAGLFFSIELATFMQPDTLKQFVAEMQRRKLPVAILDETDASGRDWHHVRLGSFPTLEQATLRLAELRRDHGLSGVVVSEAPAPPAPTTRS